MGEEFGDGLVLGICGGALPVTPFDSLALWLLTLFTPWDNVDLVGTEGTSRGGSLLVGGGLAKSCVGALGGKDGIGLGD